MPRLPSSGFASMPNRSPMLLAGAGKIYRYYTPVPESAKEAVCVTVPAPGSYALLVIHDMNGNSKPDFLSDGFGLSTNPKLALRKPKLSEALFTVEEGETVLEIDMQYVTGNKKKRCRGRRC
ncbi:MAG: DUF2141 domain-containing protein [Pseudomonadota bacterium]